MSELKEDIVKEYTKNRRYIFLELIKYCKNNESFRDIIFCDLKGYKYRTQWENFKSSKNFKIITYSNPYSLENAKLYLKLNNIDVEILSNKINNVTEKLKFKCPQCGEIFECSWTKLKYRKYYLCDECLKKNNVYKNNKLNLEDVKNTFDDKGFIPIDIKQYNGNTTYMDFKDEEGYLYNFKYSNLQSGKNPRRFSTFNKYTINNIKLYLQKIKSDTILLSKEYKNDKDLLEFKCGNCGKIFYRSWTNLQSQKYKYCEDCCIQKRGETRRLELKDIKNKFSIMGFNLLDDNYKGNSKRLLCEDEFGYRGFVPYNHLDRIKISSRAGFDYFSIKHNKENFIYNINNYCSLNGLNTIALKILEDDDSYSKSTILFKCECGEEFTTTINSFKGGKQRCDKCSSRLSLYEFKTINYLNSLNIKYVRQKRFKDCVNILPLPFDFYIKELNLLIEVDGEGHYQECYFNGCSKENAIKTLKMTQHNDSIKTEYCKNNNIKLLRIPYWEYKEDNYKEILFNNIINV